MPESSRPVKLTTRTDGRDTIGPALERLYAGFNHPDSATDPIQIVRRFTRPDDRRSRGLLRERACVRPRGERAAVDSLRSRSEVFR